MNQKEKIETAEYTGELKIGEMVFPCSVLSDGKTRILTQSDFMAGMGMYYSGWIAKEGTADRPHFLAFKSLEPFIDKHLGNLQSITVKYISKKKRGVIAHGIKAEIIPKILEIWLDADEHGKLGPRQKEIAARAKVLMRALAHVGIIALVDEATGYQEKRQADELQSLLAAFISEELMPWTKRFPDEFYKQLFRLYGWQYNPMSVKRPRLIGKLTKNIVYERISRCVLQELERKNPPNANGNRPYKHHQYLTEDIGHPALDKHIAGVIALMRASHTKTQFQQALQRAYPLPDEQMILDMD